MEILVSPLTEVGPLTVVLASSSPWSYSLSAVQKMIEVTLSKQWIHFLRSERCPPTSNMCIDSWPARREPLKDWLLGHGAPMLNRVSEMPVLFCRARSASATVGTKPGAPIRSTSLKKLARVSPRRARATEAAH